MIANTLTPAKPMAVQSVAGGKTWQMIRSHLKLMTMKISYSALRVLETMITASNRTLLMVYMPGLENLRWKCGQLKTIIRYHESVRNTPAYSKFIFKNGDFMGCITSLEEIPVMDKENYVKKFTIEERCKNGIIPIHGTVIDESSGSTGVPANWVRGLKERRKNQRVMKLALDRIIGRKDYMIINSFALGPWATGMNVSEAFSSSGLIKSLGPDIPKIINSLKLFGKKRAYAIMGYPPFLKSLADSNEISWHEYNVTFIHGGEAMSVGMMNYLKERGIKKTISSFGASDLELNMGTETEFCRALREKIASSEEWKKAFLKYTGQIPMIFQYNPADFFVETNNEGELIITLCRSGYVCPKIRYNIHDKGHILRRKELNAILKTLGSSIDELGGCDTDLPLLFHYGRSDQSVAWYGCKISPSHISDGVFSLKSLAAVFSSFAMKTVEDAKLNKKLEIYIELADGVDKAKIDSNKIEKEFIEQLKIMNQDFRESHRLAPETAHPSVIFFNKGEGLFSKSDIRIKLKYLA